VKEKEKEGDESGYDGNN